MSKRILQQINETNDYFPVIARSFFIVTIYSYSRYPMLLLIYIIESTIKLWIYHIDKWVPFYTIKNLKVYFHSFTYKLSRLLNSLKTFFSKCNNGPLIIPLNMYHNGRWGNKMPYWTYVLCITYKDLSFERFLRSLLRRFDIEWFVISLSFVFD